MIAEFRRDKPLAALAVLVLAAFLMGGGARSDVTSLIALRPLGAIILALAVAWMPREAWARNRSLLAVAFAWIGLTALHMVPLPPAIWQSLAGRDLAVRIDEAAGLAIWRPLSLVPWRTMNALAAYMLPLAALLLTLQIGQEGRKRIVYILLAAALASVGLGLLQIIGGPGNAFYLYRVTNAEGAVGLFANRNHNAIFLSLGFPLLAAGLALFPGATERVRLREWGGAGVGLLLIPFILSTQSRAGLIVGLVCAGLAVWVYRGRAFDTQKRRPRTIFDPRLLFGALAALGLVALTVVYAATNVFERMGRVGGADDELRLQIWPTIATLAKEFFPWGSGIGTFVEIYATREPARMLAPSYVNHAHNDWLESLLDGGLPAAVVLVAALVLLVRAGLRSFRTAARNDGTVLARLGVVICFVLALTSIYDYPVRTPSLAILLGFGAALACGSVFKTPSSRPAH